jgi:TDG/mug DNA glycosylase family protein
MTVLPNVLELGLKDIFCGTAVGSESARVNAYYAKPGNQFWGVLYRVGLTPRQLASQEFGTLSRYGFGLTDLVKMRSGSDNSLNTSDFECEELRAKILWYAPKALAFNGRRNSGLCDAVYLWGRSTVLGGIVLERVGRFCPELSD